MTDPIKEVLLKLRCSKLPMHLACPASTDKPNVLFQRGSKPSSLGNAIHDICKEIVEDDLSIIPDVARYAAKWAVDDLYEDLVYLAWAAVDAWKSLREKVTNVVVEKYATKMINKTIKLTGTADFRGVSGVLPVILDWKSGRLREVDYWDQLMGYLYLHVPMTPLRMKTDSEVVGLVAIAWLRFGDVEVREVTKAMLWDFKAKVIKTVRRNDYMPGNHCHFCPKKAECPARSQLVETARNDLISLESQTGSIPSATLADLYPRALLLKDSLDSYFETLREVLNFGSIAGSDGQVLSFTDETRTKLDTAKALPFIKQVLGLDYLSQLEEIISIPKGKLMKIIGAGSPKEERQALRQDFLWKLERAGAIKETIARKITVERNSDGNKS